MVFDPAATDLVVGIVGAGTMGRGIAQVAAMAGIEVRLADARPGADADAEAFIVAMLERSVEKGKIEAAAARRAVERITPVGDRLAALAGCRLVVEAIVEDLDAKRSLFRDLEQVVDPDCVIATNTSSLSVTAVAAACRRPQRVAGLHFFNPVPLMRLVEVARGEHTDAAVVDALVGLAERLGHYPAVTADSPGFVVNHAGRGLPTEALRIAEEGVADFVTIDRIVRASLGLRMGPFELMDLVGLDVSHAVMESIYRQFYEEPRFRPSTITARRVAAGLLGRKTGHGFYDYANGGRVEPAESDNGTEPVPLFVGPGDRRDELVALLRDSGVGVIEATDPPDGQAIVMMPRWTDATTAALDSGYDPTRTVAVDPWFGFDRRLTLMATSATDPRVVAGARASLRRTGRAVSVVGDSVGYVAPRIASSIVNVGCEIAQRRIADPATIDRAVGLGLGYPSGPLALGDRVGPTELVRLLEALHAASGDPRYRVSPWLRRRAVLEVSLTTPESDLG